MLEGGHSFERGCMRLNTLVGMGSNMWWVMKKKLRFWHEVWLGECHLISLVIYDLQATELGGGQSSEWRGHQSKF
jgi:hypothetical protein